MGGVRKGFNIPRAPATAPREEEGETPAGPWIGDFRAETQRRGGGRERDAVAASLCEAFEGEGVQRDPGGGVTRYSEALWHL
jgi:hypothetical protein